MMALAGLGCLPTRPDIFCLRHKCPLKMLPCWSGFDNVRWMPDLVGMKNRRLIIILVLLAVSIVGYYRVQGIEHVTTVQFLSIFAIGVMTGMLIREIGQAIRDAR